ncbi:MAG: hypothetical protein Q9218_001539 [Villophora microphyllina]
MANPLSSGPAVLSSSQSLASSHVVSPPRRAAHSSRPALRGPGPQLPAFLASAPHYDDPAAAARAQYSGNTATLQTRSSAQIVPTFPIQSGAVRTGTGTLGTLDQNASASPDASSLRSTVTSSRGENVLSSRASSSSINDTLPRFPTAGNRAGASTAPRLPAFLAKAQPPRDPGAAAREQYGRKS